MLKQRSPVEMAMQMVERINEEDNGQYKPIYDALRKLDTDFPKVTENQHRVDLGNDAMEYAYANLLFSSHAAYLYPNPPTHTRKDALSALRLMNTIPSGKIAVVELLFDLFPQAVVCTEHLYFVQRQIRRIFTLPDAERPDLLRGMVLEEWVYPDDRIDQLRVDAIELWKQVEDKDDADETRK